MSRTGMVLPVCTNRFSTEWGSGWMGPQNMTYRQGHTYRRLEWTPGGMVRDGSAAIEYNPPAGWPRPNARPSPHKGPYLQSPARSTTAQPGRASAGRRRGPRLCLGGPTPSVNKLTKIGRPPHLPPLCQLFDGPTKLAHGRPTRPPGRPT